MRRKRKKLLLSHGVLDHKKDEEQDDARSPSKQPGQTANAKVGCQLKSLDFHLAGIGDARDGEGGEVCLFAVWTTRLARMASESTLAAVLYQNCRPIA